MTQYQRSGFLSSIPPVTRHLLIINVLIWLVIEVCSFSGARMEHFADFLVTHLGLNYVGSSGFNPVQPLTYMFVHDPFNIMHILFNMFALWMFGRLMEQVWGQKRFLIYYMVCGIGAAVVQEAVWALCWQHDFVTQLAAASNVSPQYVEQAIAAKVPNVMQFMADYKSQLITVGASGAIFGILLGFAFVFPNMPLYFFFIPVPVKAKWMVLGYAVLEFFLGVGGMQSSVAHFAHLGGMLFALPMLLYWKRKGTLQQRFF